MNNEQTPAPLSFDSPQVQEAWELPLTDYDVLRFWAKVDRTPFCWNWTANRSDSGRGYGSYSFKNKLYGAHRISWLIHNGHIDPGMCVLHICDNRCCVNPAHLKLGTYSENAVDMMQKGRCPYRRLTDQNVRSIRDLRAAGTPASEIAKLYGITGGYVRVLVRREASTYV